MSWQPRFDLMRRVFDAVKCMACRKTLIYWRPLPAIRGFLMQSACRCCTADFGIFYKVYDAGCWSCRLLISIYSICSCLSKTRAEPVSAFRSVDVTSHFPPISAVGLAYVTPAGQYARYRSLARRRIFITTTYLPYESACFTCGHCKAGAKSLCRPCIVDLIYSLTYVSPTTVGALVSKA